MIPITDARVEAYMNTLCPAPEPVVLAMEAEARERSFPIVDRLVGHMLYQLTLMARPRLVVELGSGFGYSAYWFARAMKDAGAGNGTVVLTDRSAKNLESARAYLDEAGLLGHARFHHGDALETAMGYDEIGVLFMDLDKQAYAHAAEAMAPRIMPGGLLIADNVLWYGRVAEPDPPEDPDNTLAVRQFNEMMYARAEFHCTILPLRDGVMVARKKG